MTNTRELRLARKAAQRAVEDAAEAQRALLVSQRPAKVAVYGLKAVEADRLAADPAPDAKRYPVLAPEAEALGVDLSALGATVRAKRDLWLAAAGAIEAAAKTAKAAIAAATTEDEIRAAATVTWPTPTEA